jgi:hypothetical protein
LSRVDEGEKHQSYDDKWIKHDRTVVIGKCNDIFFPSPSLWNGDVKRSQLF